jgi:hypothetical protein
MKSLKAMKLALDTLDQYATPHNWDEDFKGVKRKWLEPDSNSRNEYNGFELAQKTLKVLQEAIAAEEAQSVELIPECWYESSELKMCCKCGRVHDKAITHPAPATAPQDSLDAARYRWLRSTTNYVTSKLGGKIDVRNCPEDWDAAIDAAMGEAQ